MTKRGIPTRLFANERRGESVKSTLQLGFQTFKQVLYIKTFVIVKQSWRKKSTLKRARGEPEESKKRKLHTAGFQGNETEFLTRAAFGSISMGFLLLKPL